MELTKRVTIVECTLILVSVVLFFTAILSAYQGKEYHHALSSNISNFSYGAEKNLYSDSSTIDVKKKSDICSANPSGKEKKGAESLVCIYKDKDNTIVLKESQIIYNGTNSTYGIQLGIDSFLSGDKNPELLLYPGKYDIRSRLMITQNLYFHGNRDSTILNYADIGNKNTIALAKGVRLEDITLLGSIDPLPKDFTQKIQVGDNVTIKNIVISGMGYGIELTGAKNVTLDTIKCEHLQSKSDWAACIHGGAGTENIKIVDFKILNSNRGIEMEDAASNVTAKNGFLSNIKNFNGSGHEAFSIDVHSHNGKGSTHSIVFKNIYLENSYAPTSKIAQSGSNYSLSDLPAHLLYDNITVVNPTSVWQVGGHEIEISNSQVINSSHDIIELLTDAQDISLANISSNKLDDENYFIFNGPNSTGVKNISISNSSVIDSASKKGFTMLFQQISNLNLKNNKMMNVPSDTIAMGIFRVDKLHACNNHIFYFNGTKEIWKNIC